LIAPSTFSTGKDVHDNNAYHRLVDINGGVRNGELQFTWNFANSVIRTDLDVERVAAAFISNLSKLAILTEDPEAGGVTPSDFPLLSGVTQQQIDRLMGTGRSIEDAFPLTPLQEGMLFHTMLESHSELYINQTRWSIRSDKFDLATFRLAWDQVVDRHPILRTGFAWKGLAAPIQIVYKSVNIPWVEKDLRASADGAEAAVRKFMVEDRVTGFDETSAPLMRFTILRVAELKYEIVWTHHHILLDGWSTSILSRDLASAMEGNDISAAPSGRSFKSYVDWLLKQDIAASEYYWRDLLKGFSSPTALPNALPKTGTRTSHAAQHIEEIFVPSETTTVINDATKKFSVTLSTLSQAAWGLLLAAYSRESDIVFGTTVSGRASSDLGVGIEGTVGLLINTVPVRLDMGPRGTVEQLLQAVQQQQVDTVPFEWTSLQRVQSWTDLASGLPLFQSLLVFENYPLNTATAGGFGAEEVQTYERTNLPLTVQVQLTGPRLVVTILYEDDRFTKATIDSIGQHFVTFLLSLARADGASKLRDLPLIEPSESQSIIADFNKQPNAIPEFDMDILMHHQFEAMAQANPDSVALVYDDEQLTYSELDRRANQLARLLIQQGVTPDTAVGICMYRSIELIVSMVAVLKCGAFYVPVDPTYPPARQSYMLEDSRAPVLIAHDKFNASLAPGAKIFTMPFVWEVVNTQTSGLFNFFPSR
jgi:hypothetical protein